MVLDLLVLIILGFCTWQGYRKGLILTVAGLLVLVIAIWGGTKVADKFADVVVEKVTPLINWVSDDATEDAMSQNGRTGSPMDKSTITTIAERAFSTLGVFNGETEKMADRVYNNMTKTGESIRSSISSVFVRTLCWVLLFIFGFTVVALLLTLLAHFISMLFTLPGLKMVDTIGGLASGLLYGMLILFAIGWMMRFLGLIIPTDLVEGTFFLRFFVTVNPLSAFIS